jgi:hypothetical protein
MLRRAWPLLGICLGAGAEAQSILLDHVTACGPLICYPSAADTHQYYYLPREPRLVYREDGTPEFSFLRYVLTAERTTDFSGVSTSDGGGVVHFLVSYETTPVERRRALEVLRENDEDAVLAGSVTFEEGHFALVSSIASLPAQDQARLFAEQPEAKQYAYAVAGIGRAPLLEGLKSAVSIHLSKLGSDILMGSFETTTPDISLVFDLTYSGLRDPANVVITGNWQNLHKYIEARVGAEIGYGPIDLGFNYDDMWDDARTTGAIKISSTGDVADLERYVDRAYERLQDLMFEPVPVESYEDKTADLANMLQQMMYAAGNENRDPGGMGGQKPFNITLKGGFKRRQIEREGNFTLDFRRQTSERITTAMAGNIGNLHSRFAANDRVFRTINVGDDPVYRYRPVSVVVDLRNTEDFAKYVNSVTFRMIKTHGSGKSSLGEVVITRSTFDQGANLMVGYPWDGEKSYPDWLAYDYEVVWSFIGGARDQQAGRSSDSAFTLSAPYEYRQVQFLANRDTLQRRGVKHLTVRVTHELYGRRHPETITLGPAVDSYEETREFAVPPDGGLLSYNVTWQLEDDRKVDSGPRSSDEQVIWVDE